MEGLYEVFQVKRLCREHGRPQKRRGAVPQVHDCCRQGAVQFGRSGSADEGAHTQERLELSQSYLKIAGAWCPAQ